MLGVTGGYLFVVVLLSIAGAIAGFISHHVRAEIGQDERPLWDDGVSGFILRQEHESDKAQGWKFNDGRYDGLSDSNLLRYVIGGAVFPVLICLVCWTPGVETFVATCKSLAQSGFAPGFCPR